MTCVWHVMIPWLDKIHSDMTHKIELVSSQAFAIFCGLGIHNALMYEQACKLLAKQSVAMEVNNYMNSSYIVTLSL